MIEVGAAYSKRWRTHVQRLPAWRATARGWNPAFARIRRTECRTSPGASSN
jgi:hypothetical protein